MKHFNKILSNNSGSILLIFYFTLVVFLGISAALMVLTANETNQVARQKVETTAFEIAEAGLERGLYDLRQDFVGASNPSWSDGIINSMNVTVNTADFSEIPYSDTTLNDGEYHVYLQNIAGKTDHVWLRSIGTHKDSSHTLDVYVKIVDMSPWNYAIFAGSGASGTMINGVVDIRGSVIILGTGLAAGDYAVDLGGTAQIVANNYSSMPATLRAKVPALPTVTYNGETVETLNATLRVKNGIIGVSGNASVGEINVTGNAYKETVDAVYCNNGFGGNKAAAGVYSDNGTSNAYDLGDAVAFPKMTDPYLGYSSYADYLKNTGYVVSSAEAAQLNAITPKSSFTIGDAKGRISVNNGTMTVDGIIYMDQNGTSGSKMSINFVKSGSSDTLTYTGKGSVYTSGDVNVGINIVTSGNGSFPNNAMGIMTPNSINMDAAGMSVMGLFYAGSSINVSKQTNLVGTIVSNYFNMGTNVPAIFQVPATKENMPPGMIGSSSKWYLVVGWLKR